MYTTHIHLYFKGKTIGLFSMLILGIVIILTHTHTHHCSMIKHIQTSFSHLVTEEI